MRDLPRPVARGLPGTPFLWPAWRRRPLVALALLPGLLGAGGRFLRVRAGDSRMPVEASGEAIFIRECAACHGRQGDGHGPAAGFLPRRPRDLRAGRFKLRSTAPGEAPRRADLRATVTRGITVSAMPAFDYLPAGELEAVLDHVQHLAGIDQDVEPPALELTVDPGSTPDVLARGAAVHRDAGCRSCHEPGREPGTGPQRLEDHAGQPITAPHLVRDRFLAPDDPHELMLRFLSGMDGTPMPSYELLPAPDLWALAHHVSRLHAPVHDPRPRTRNPARAARPLVAQYGCQGCHVLEGRGGTVGPDLDRASEKLRPSWIRHWLTDPRAEGHIYPEHPYRMPDLKIPPDEVEILVRYLAQKGRRRLDEPPEQIPPPDPGQIAEGRRIYRERCTMCHALGDQIPATVERPAGPDLIRIARRTTFDWLMAILLVERLDQAEAVRVRAFLWDATAGAPPGR